MSGWPPGDSPLEEFARGLAKGTLEAAGPSVKEYVALLFSGKLAFIGRRDYIAEVKARRQSPEWLFYREYIKDKRLSLLAQLGLTLRDWEDDPVHKKDIQQLRQRIFLRHGQEGVHIAQVVQSRVLTGVVPAVLSSTPTKDQAAKLIEAFLKDSFRLCRFIQEKDRPAALARDLRGYLTANRPPLFVFFYRGSANRAGNSVVKSLADAHPDYSYQVHDIYASRIVVFTRSDLTTRARAAQLS